MESLPSPGCQLQPRQETRQRQGTDGWAFQLDLAALHDGHQRGRGSTGHWLMKARETWPVCPSIQSSDPRTSREHGPSTSPSFKAARQISEREPCMTARVRDTLRWAGKPDMANAARNPSLRLIRPHLHSPASPLGPTRGQALLGAETHPCPLFPLSLLPLSRSGACSLLTWPSGQACWQGRKTTCLAVNLAHWKPPHSPARPRLQGFCCPVAA